MNQLKLQHRRSCDSQLRSTIHRSVQPSMREHEPAAKAGATNELTYVISNGEREPQGNLKRSMLIKEPQPGRPKQSPSKQPPSKSPSPAPDSFQDPSTSKLTQQMYLTYLKHKLKDTAKMRQLCQQQSTLLRYTQKS